MSDIETYPEYWESVTYEREPCCHNCRYFRKHQCTIADDYYDLAYDGRDSCDNWEERYGGPRR